MKLFQKALVLSSTLLSLSLPSLAQERPRVNYASVPTPYGILACRQRAETKLFSIGATNVALGSGNPPAVWGNFGATVIGVWCRGDEAIIIVAGKGNVFEVREDVISAF